MEITNKLRNNKKELLSYFRSNAREIISKLSSKYGVTQYEKIASGINKEIETVRKRLLELVSIKAMKEGWSKREYLETDLMILYTSYVAMLEGRNSVREYEYMDFSRRIGEMWEPFCKECFAKPLTNIAFYLPPLFSEVQSSLSAEISTFISHLKISQEDREKLLHYYKKVWGLVTSGEIQLASDLHFTDGKTKWVVDFKSGFGSNEKGNTNRLLLVGSIYKNIESEKYKCEMFVRSTDNNAYLKRISESGVWRVFCGSAAYRQISRYTGFPLDKWIKTNIHWKNDFNDEMNSTITEKKLEEYLKW